MLNQLLVSAALASIIEIAAHAAPIEQSALQEDVDQTRAAHELVALGAAVATLGTEPVIAVSGQRKAGADDRVQPGDAWHIGSNTKALTALLYASLAEEGQANWGATLPDLFPNLASEMDPAWANIAIEDLFAHRSGIGGLGPLWLIARRADSDPLQDQRLSTTRERLTAPPHGSVGDFEYSNVNYIVGGAAIERILDMPWDAAMQAHIFEVEGSDWSLGWGSGPPQAGIEGHRRNLFGKRSAVGTGTGADNPQALGPAGTLHVPLLSHAELLLEFVDEDSTLITPGMRRHLLAPWPDEEADYAMGWALREDDSLGTIYLHNGSNTMWLSRVALIPSRDAVIIVNANEFSDASREATDAVMTRLLDEVAAMDPVSPAP